MSLLVKGVASFTGLVDTPAAYAGQAERIAAVNPAENGLEFRPHSKFATTRVFDGETASPPTIWLSPFTMIPYYDLGYGQYTRLYRYLACVYNGYLYVGGGYDGIGTHTNLHYRFNLTTEKWERLANVPNTAENYSMAFPISGVHADRIYYYAPYDSGGTADYVLEYDIAGDSWAIRTPPASIGPAEEAVLYAASDALYLYRTDRNEPAFSSFVKMDYATHAWTTLTKPPVNPCHTGGLIGDEIFIVERTGSRRTMAYNKASDSWLNTIHNCPTFLGAPGFYNEDRDAIWGATYPGPPAVYRFTLAGGWVHQFTAARDSGVWDWIIRPAGKQGFFALYGVCGGMGSYSENVGGGAIHEYTGTGIWELLTQHYDEGDLMIINVTSGVPVNVEANGALRFVSKGMDTVYVIDTADYYFTLSKDYRFDGITIWRSVWG